MTPRHFRPAPLITLLCTLAPPAATATPHVTTEYGIDFVTVGDAGNRNTTIDELIYTDPSLFEPRGAVGYEFRIARTEVTAGEWLEFAQAYAPHIVPAPGESRTDALFGLAGGELSYNFFTEQFNLTSPVDAAAGVQWRYAARYANWVHNGRTNDASAFESGVYDTSEFAYDEQTGLLEYSPNPASDARVRLPTGDEWLKSAHYDPNRYGEGEGGYWRYQNRSDTRPTTGPPGEGETDLGLLIETPVGSYPENPSPWGVFDTGGTYQEWTESEQLREFSSFTTLEIWGPASAQLGAQEIDFIQSSGPLNTNLSAIRLVAPVPSPTVNSISILCAIYIRKRRQR